MVALTDVTLTAGLGTGGTGTVSTLDKFNGTAGTPTTQVLTVQGVASGTAQPVSIATAPVLVAGSAIIGKVGIDQTTDLTTNKVRAFIHDGTTALTVLAGSSGAPATSVAALPVSLRDVNANGLAVPGSSAPVVIAPQTLDVTVTPTVTASAYTANNILGGIMTFANILPSVGTNGVLQSITAKFKATTVTGNLTVAIFKANPSNGTYADKTAGTYNSADMANLIGIYQLTTPLPLGAYTMTVYNLDGIGKAFVGSSTSLFAIVTVAGTPTPASTSDFSLMLSVLPG